MAPGQGQKGVIMKFDSVGSNAHRKILINLEGEITLPFESKKGGCLDPIKGVFFPVRNQDHSSKPNPDVPLFLEDVDHQVKENVKKSKGPMRPDVSPFWNLKNPLEGPRT